MKYFARNKRGLLVAGISAAALIATSLAPVGSAIATVTTTSAVTPPQLEGYSAGVTPFIADVAINNVTMATLKNVSFTVTPMSGSTTTPISATYEKAYFVNRPSLVSGSTITVPVYGLYASAVDNSNHVTVAVTTTSATTVLTAAISTTPWQDSCTGCYTTRLQYVHARDNAVHLGYSYFMLKSMFSGQVPVIVMDTDGQVRWVANDTSGGSGTSVSGFIGQSFYATHGARLYRFNLDGSESLVHDFSGYQGINNFWHNIDPGNTGMLLSADGASSSNESTVLEVNTDGSVAKMFDVYQIISQAMTAGGDNPSDFVSQGGDWFHMNAETFWPARNEVVVSSREDFVIGINYATQKIDWILGDPTKQWYQFKSLRHFALALAPGTLPPIGQHALSITPTGQLLLFDDGYGSGSHSPTGNSRSYSIPQMFQINFATRTAKQTWAYYNNPPIQSAICSSVYQEAGNTYLVDYAAENSPDLIGLGANNAVAFDYQLPNTYINGAWNAYPVAINGLSFNS